MEWWVCTQQCPPPSMKCLPQSQLKKQVKKNLEINYESWMNFICHMKLVSITPTYLFTSYDLLTSLPTYLFLMTYLPTYQFTYLLSYLQIFPQIPSYLLNYLPFTSHLPFYKPTYLLFTTYLPNYLPTNHYNKRCPYTPNDFTIFRVTSLVLVNGD
jgi:hypothetical protein